MREGSEVRARMKREKTCVLNKESSIKGESRSKKNMEAANDEDNECEFIAQTFSY